MSLEGQHLGEFEILEHIGQGGMGAVFKARQTSLQRLVALKTLKPFVSDDPDFVARFRQEAVAAAALSHPNLVQVYAAGEAEGIHYFAMEYIEGEAPDGIAERPDRLLCENPHYAWCRQLGQLEPSRLFAIRAGGYETFAARRLSQGRQLGEIKPCSLSKEADWSTRFYGGYLDPQTHRHLESATVSGE
jgi:hypothetical protein